jgi:hypothetical protein
MKVGTTDAYTILSGGVMPVRRYLGKSALDQVVALMLRWRPGGSARYSRSTVANRPEHMHTVPAGYLRGFADTSASRRNPRLWRFEREAGLAKLISVRDASVCRNIYTLRSDDGKADTTIETELLSSAIEHSFPSVVQLLSYGGRPSYRQWRVVSRFMAFQLARTPRMFQIFRDEGSRHGIDIGPNDPQLAMVYQAPFLEKWLYGMPWILCWNGSTLPLLTSDNPLVMWADRGEGAELGVGFQEPALRILFPLTPKICLTALQTETSLRAVVDDVPESNPRFSDFYALRLHSGWLGIDQAVMLNQVVVSNAEQYVYANSNDEKVRLLLDDLFFGLSGPVRRFDRKPIGSPIAPEVRVSSE